MYKLQSIDTKQNQKQTTYESNKLCMIQTGKKKPLEVLKTIKTIYISNKNIVEDKSTISIRWAKLTISFYKKILSFINNLQLLFLWAIISNWKLNDS